MEDTTRKSIFFQDYITIHMYIFIFYDEIIAKIKKCWSLFSGGHKVFGFFNFYASHCVFKVKQPYTLGFVKIPVGVVTHLGDFTENPPHI